MNDIDDRYPPDHGEPIARQEFQLPEEDPPGLDGEVHASSIGSSESLAALAARGLGEFVPFADARPKGCEVCSFSPDGCSFCSGRSAIDILGDQGIEVIDATGSNMPSNIYDLPADPDQEIPDQ